MELLVKAGGLYCICLIIFHLLFWRIFDWEKDLRSLTFLNRAIMQVLNLSLTFVFFIFAYVSLFHARELLHSGLGRSLLLLIALFWLLRALQQVIFFRLAHWRSIAFLFIFLSGAVLYGIPALSVVM